MTDTQEQEDIVKSKIKEALLELQRFTDIDDTRHEEDFRKWLSFGVNTTAIDLLLSGFHGESQKLLAIDYIKNGYYGALYRNVAMLNFYIPSRVAWAVLKLEGEVKEYINKTYPELMNKELE